MTYLWPRLHAGIADDLFEQISFDSQPVVTGTISQHPKAYFAAVGTPISPDSTETVRRRILDIAFSHGYPAEQGVEVNEKFDLAITGLSQELFPMGWAEAASTEVWSHIALVLLPDITWWRWRLSTSQSKTLNRERFVGSDLTRHAWARYWWRHRQTEGDLSILELFGEAGLNQILERRDSLGSSQAFISAIAGALRPHAEREKRAPRNLVRDVSSRALRQMAFIDDSALDQEDRVLWAEELVASSIEAMEASDS